MIDPDYVITTSRALGASTGLDSMLMGIPESFQGPDGIEMHRRVRFHAYLTAVSLEAARQINEALHHATWWVTRDPELVEELGMTHDCDLCRAGTDQALARLAQFPETFILAGVLYWADLS